MHAAVHRDLELRDAHHDFYDEATQWTAPQTHRLRQFADSKSRLFQNEGRPVSGSLPALLGPGLLDKQKSSSKWRMVCECNGADLLPEDLVPAELAGIRIQDDRVKPYLSGTCADPCP